MACKVSVLLYGSETWTLTESEWARLQSFHMQCRRHILAIKLSDFTTNELVRSTIDLDEIRDIIQHRRLGIFGHMVWLPLGIPASECVALLVMALHQLSLEAFTGPTTHHVTSSSMLRQRTWDCWPYILAEDRTEWRAVDLACGLCLWWWWWWFCWNLPRSVLRTS